MNDRKPKSVKLDYFLYSCFEFEQTCRSTPARSVGAERWPAVVDFIEGKTENFTQFGDLEKQIDQALAWYVEKFPALVEEKRLDLANLSGIIPGIVFFALDIRTLCRISSEIDELVYDEALTINPAWDMLEKLVNQRCGDLKHFLLSYLRWTFAQKKETHWEIGSRPPIGKYAPRRSAVRGNQKERGGRFSSGGGNGNRQNNRRSPHPNSGGGGQRRGGGGGPQGNHRSSSPQRGRTQQKESQALAIVEDAVKELKSNPDLNEIQLPPANSFYRRLQHKHVMTLGFYSQSAGEGQDRAVVICRSNQSVEDDE